MNPEQLGAWVDGYVRAWASNDPADIGALFTDDAAYYTAPYREPWRGREAIVAGWLDRKDEPGEYDFRHQILAVAGDLGFVRGWTRYHEGPEKLGGGTSYSNLWVVRLAPDGPCSEFTEWWMEDEKA